MIIDEGIIEDLNKTNFINYKSKKIELSPD